ncbi:Fpg/Nei family DNA glycosylase [Microcoleus sp. FACHB-831]|uniref:Fpg/Nei family DNA glycosylase n=1 Tax=Microcoleus sp. FACHB-831 TaxID=2692827 RepID=UPI0016881B59|nr:Fpg/Nei family DNA glycosylase [Microcoleus sp. FACHB-831]MBD1921727.1 Fpg/Nei family DNA glycosylase [Microcoleus sp. FACHB-831]
MPEGPEVRRFADSLCKALEGKEIISLMARTRGAKAWLLEHPGVLINRRIERVRSRGKHLYCLIEGGYYFHSHLMMWGRWAVESEVPLEIDRRERARIVVPDAIAILYSAPIFEIGAGDPFELVENLRTLGPDILPYPEEGLFDTVKFKERLLTPENSDRAIGAALLDQQILAGIGNYLRAEILFDCRLDPWKLVGELTTNELERLCESIVKLALRADEKGGVTVSDEERSRMKTDSTLVYQLGREYGNRHYVFRRTNLPCLRCNDTIRQLRQVTRADEEGEKSRIIYFCPSCQGTTVELKKSKSKSSKVAAEGNKNDAEIASSSIKKTGKRSRPPVDNSENINQVNV